MVPLHLTDFMNTLDAKDRVEFTSMPIEDRLKRMIDECNKEQEAINAIENDKEIAVDYSMSKNKAYTYTEYGSDKLYYIFSDQTRDELKYRKNYVCYNFQGSHIADSINVLSDDIGYAVYPTTPEDLEKDIYVKEY